MKANSLICTVIPITSSPTKKIEPTYIIAHFLTFLYNSHYNAKKSSILKWVINKPLFTAQPATYWFTSAFHLVAKLSELAISVHFLRSFFCFYPYQYSPIRHFPLLFHKTLLPFSNLSDPFSILTFPTLTLHIRNILYIFSIPWCTNFLSLCQDATFS